MKRGKLHMTSWEDEILNIQRDIFLSTCSVVLIEPEPRLRDVYAFAITLAGYAVLPLPFEQARLWLLESEARQAHSLIFLFDASESKERDGFLAQVQETRRRLSRPLKTISTLWQLSDEKWHPAIDVILQKLLDIGVL